MSDKYLRALTRAVTAVCSQAPVNDSLRAACVDILRELGLPPAEAEKLASGKTAVIRGSVPEPLRPIVVNCRRGEKSFVVLAPIVYDDRLEWVLRFARRAFASGGPYPVFRDSGGCETPAGIEMSLVNNPFESLSSVLVKVLELAAGKEMRGKIEGKWRNIDKVGSVTIIAPGIGLIGSYLVATLYTVADYVLGKARVIAPDWGTETVVSLVRDVVCGGRDKCGVDASHLARVFRTRDWAEMLRHALDYYTISATMVGDTAVIATGVVEDLVLGELEAEVREPANRGQ